MCSAPKIEPPPPPPAAPMVLEQPAPKTAKSSSVQERKRKGLSRYKIQPNASQPAGPTTKQLGGIPKKKGV